MIAVEIGKRFNVAVEELKNVNGTMLFQMLEKRSHLLPTANITLPTGSLAYLNVGSMAISEMSRKGKLIMQNWEHGK